MWPKLDRELFYKLLKLFFRGVQVSSLNQIHWSMISFLSQNALNITSVTYNSTCSDVNAINAIIY